MSNQQIDVQIMGQSYILGCPEGGQERLLDAVRKVDEAMCKIRDAGKIKARDRIAVLAALNLAFEQTPASPAVTTAHTEDEMPLMHRHAWRSCCSALTVSSKTTVN
ncbi:cell division protein ZapA [Limnohabitans sp. 2KL-1]|uniref:cell division protein ZapA n=1 Tax=Limnohabitans sp. 2KL-1 TaxID=1100699 RepID=UPI0026C1DE7E